MPEPIGNREEVSRRRGVRWLLAAQASDGGWGYRPGHTAYVEPTALGALALLQERRSTGEAAGLGRALERLRATQRPDGSWGISPADDSPSWMTAYATWALLQAEGVLGERALRPAIDSALEWLLAEANPPVPLDQLEGLHRISRIDGALVGWPWFPGDAYWVFPTAISLVAAGLDGRTLDLRVRQGVAFLRDRVCEGGGWNIGNPYTFDKAFAPTVVDTSAALLALKAVGEGSSAVAVAGLARLLKLVSRATSPVGLAWGILSLRSYGVGVAEAQARLVSLQSPDGSWRANAFATALAVLALGSEPPFAAAARDRRDEATRA